MIYEDVVVYRYIKMSLVLLSAFQSASAISRYSRGDSVLDGGALFLPPLVAQRRSLGQVIDLKRTCLSLTPGDRVLPSSSRVMDSCSISVVVLPSCTEKPEALFMKS